MTRLNLLDALTSFTNEVMREIFLPVRRQKGNEDVQESLAEKTMAKMDERLEHEVNRILAGWGG